MLRSSGFRVPETIVTTDPAVARKFCESVGEVVYKSVSSIRTIVTRVRQSDLERLDNVASCPTQFQEYVPGVDYRVHVVNERLFAARIDSDADDYRYSRQVGQSPSVEPAFLEAECLARYADLALRAGLVFAGIDLRLTPDGEWYCFEINPSPAFTFYDPLPALPISTAVAELLNGQT